MTGITLIAEHKRYFNNSFSENLADIITPEWIKSKIDVIFNRVASRTISNKEFEEGNKLYEIN